MNRGQTGRHIVSRAGGEEVRAFVPNPFPGTPGDRLYRTGDLGRFLGTDPSYSQLDGQLITNLQLPQLEHLLYDDPRGMRHYTLPFIHDIRELMAMGRIHNRNHPDLLIRTSGEMRISNFPGTTVSPVFKVMLGCSPMDILCRTALSSP